MRTSLASLLLLLVTAAPVPARAQAWEQAPARVAEGTSEGAALEGAGLAEQRRRLEALDARRAEVAARRRALEAELDALAADIARRKARQQAAPTLFTDPELDRRLKRSQALSARIDDLAREEDRLADALGEAARRLVDTYDRRVEAARGRLEAAPADAREAALSELARLEAERRSVQAGLDRLAPEPTVALPEARAVQDDPEDLRAQADLLRDTQDRLARRLAELDRRVESLRDQRALEAEMEGFLSETAFMDERDRSAIRFDARRSASEVDEGLSVGSGEAAEAPTDAYAGGAARDDGSQADGEPSVGEPSAGAEAPPALDNGAGAPTAEAPDGDAGTVFRFEHLTTPAEASAALEDLLRVEPGDSLEALEHRRAELESLIRRLERRAAGLEGRADRLERRR